MFVHKLRLRGHWWEARILPLFAMRAWPAQGVTRGIVFSRGGPHISCCCAALPQAGAQGTAAGRALPATYSNPTFTSPYVPSA